MADGYSSSGRGGGADSPLSVIRDIHRISGGSTFSGFFNKDCVDLVRRISLLTNFLEDIRDFERNQRIGEVGSSSSHRSCFVDLTLVLHDARRLLLAAACNLDVSEDSSVKVHKRIAIRFRGVTIALERVLMNFPYYDFEISEDVQDQVKLVRSQLKRAVGGYTTLDSSLVQSSAIETDPSLLRNWETGNFDFVKLECRAMPKTDAFLESDDSETVISRNTTIQNKQEIKNIGCCSRHSLVIPADFLCPISLELMKDPVVVATGQTYERSCIQKWIDCGNKTCPKTRQKLWHLSLTPNYLLRHLISQWCAKNSVHQSTALNGGKIKLSDGSFRDITGNLSSIQELVYKLSIGSTEDLRAAVAEIRSLSRRSTDNRILLAEAGAIPILVHLLSSQDPGIQDNAITCILNLSIYENNKELIVLSDAIPSIVRVLSTGSTEARENAAATLFCLSLVDDNKIIIGGCGAIPALVDLLRSGSSRGKKDAATALYSLCTYPRNKGRAIKAGVISPLLSMLSDSANTFVDESLTIIAVLVSYREAKSEIVKAGMIPVLIELMSEGSPRNQENAAAILLSLCKKDKGNLTSASRHGVVAPLLELRKNGIDRARRKAMQLLEILANIQH